VRKKYWIADVGLRILFDLEKERSGDKAKGRLGENIHLFISCFDFPSSDIIELTLASQVINQQLKTKS